MKPTRQEILQLIREKKLPASALETYKEVGEDELIQVAEKKVTPKEDDGEIPITTTIAFQNMKIMKEMTKYMGEMASDVDYKKDAQSVKDSVEALEKATEKIAKLEKLM